MEKEFRLFKDLLLVTREIYIKEDCKCKSMDGCESKKIEIVDGK